VPNRPIFIVGAGGFAREVRWLVEEINAQKPAYEFGGYLVPDPKAPGDHDSCEMLISRVEWLKRPPRNAAVALGIGDPAIRKKHGDEVRDALGDAGLPVLIHPSVLIDRNSCQLAPGVVICAGCIVTVNVKFGRYVRVDRACNIGHEAEIGEAASINPTVTISGGVRIGAGATIGTGVQILQYVTIGENSVVGAGALVNRDVAAGMTVVGVPAKPVKTSSE
jgi:sugar O-acyltransferase (sialic acid O-acetyltransferase NeuD family)